MPAPTKALRSKYNRKRYRELLNDGTCTKCGWRPVTPGRVTCDFCYTRWKESAEKSDPGGERRRDRQKQRRAERIAAGICTECGIRPAIEGRRMCQRCRDMRNDSTRKYKIHQRTLAMERGERKPTLEKEGKHYTKEAKA